MAVPAHTRVTFSGVVSNIDEWSFSLSFEPLTVAPASLTEAAYIAKTNALFNAYADNIKPLMGSDVQATKVRIVEVDGTGHYRTRDDGTYLMADALNSGVAGTQPPVPMPLQIALCVSLKTARPGASGKGRFFLPWPNLVVDAATKHADESELTEMMDNFARFLGGCSDAVGTDLVVPSSKGYLTPVTGIRVGRAPDTMRSRRNNLIEAYIDGPASP